MGHFHSRHFGMSWHEKHKWKKTLNVLFVFLFRPSEKISENWGKAHHFITSFMFWCINTPHPISTTDGKLVVSVLLIRIPEDFITDFSSVVFGNRYVECSSSKCIPFIHLGSGAAAMDGIQMPFMETLSLLHLSLCLQACSSRCSDLPERSSSPHNRGLQMESGCCHFYKVDVLRERRHVL